MRSQKRRLWIVLKASLSQGLSGPGGTGRAVLRQCRCVLQGSISVFIGRIGREPARSDLGAARQARQRVNRHDRGKEAERTAETGELREVYRLCLCWLCPAPAHLRIVILRPECEYRRGKYGEQWLIIGVRASQGQACHGRVKWLMCETMIHNLAGCRRPLKGS